MSIFFIIMLTVAELILIGLVFTFFIRLKRSESVVAKLQANQEQLLERVYRNATLEQELVASFAQRQEQLTKLIPHLEDRIQTMQKLLTQAEGISHSPQFLREVIQNAQKKGLTNDEIAVKTGLSKDEIELILKK